MTNTLVLVADFQAKPGQEDALRDALAEMIAPSEAEAGCLGYRPLADPAKPGAMICLEEWRDDAALETHFQTPHFQNVARILDEILAAPFTLRRLTQAPAAA
ncbi:MAG TPA: putative quinol monooxygenase [Lacisediminihabitans sp.]|uniref:putative quinol monooxygenase n=1 Tax=Lacisediminihabitans sp. TaxID=2787631 RepID=UPI002EDA5A7A